MAIDLSGFVRATKTVKLGGKDFVFTQISLNDFALFRRRVIENRRKLQKQKRKELLEQAKELGEVNILEIIKEFERMPTDAEIEAEMETLEGMGYLAYLSLKYKYPEITEDEVMSLLTISDIPAVAEAIMGPSYKDREGAEKKVVKE